MTMTRSKLERLPALLTALLAFSGQAQVSATCDQPHELDKYQLLRRLSLDLRNKVPSVAEYGALDAQSTVPQATIDAMVKSDDFRLAMRRYHEDLFWPNVSNVQLNNVNAQLTATGTQNAYRLASAGRRKLYRVNPDVNTATLGVDCGDFQATVSGVNKTPTDLRTVTNGSGVVTDRQEGWRDVEPYWAPGTTVRVCAYDAQETLQVNVGGTMVSCADPAAQGNVNCGCGPNLRFCFGPRGIVEAAILTSMREQLNRKVDEVTSGGKPYTDLIASRTSDWNGPVAFYKQYLSHNYSFGRIYAVPDDGEVAGPESAPVRGFTETNWVQNTRPALHGGVLTLPAYLLRFQTNRGRANRARIDFECSVFTPPPTLEDPATATPACVTEGTDLTKRCTCRMCHSTLEPLAAYFGQFSEAGTTILSAANFPRTRANCVGSSSGVCSRFYVTEPTEPNAGALMPYQYANTSDAVHRAIQTNLAAGPAGYATETINSHAFSKCAVRRTFAFLVKRDLHATPPDVEEVDLLNSLSSSFEANGYDFPKLIEAIVSLPQYRRVR
ncbi:MAG: hypothetical protein K1X89_01595 [Myxococcaceae bacterium]|nr:hypothetical protein [Myxococcaceae bacterium]